MDVRERQEQGGSPFLGVASPVLGEEEVEAVAEVLRSGWVIRGPRVGALEDQLAAYLEASNVVCLSSCTAGISLALRVAGVGPGDEVLLPSLTFVSCANAVEHHGAHPVFVDSEPDTGLIDLDAAEAAITLRTRAIMPVHLGGVPADLDRVADLRERYGLIVIEDAAHAIGARWHGRRIGAHGNFVTFSFHASKNMTTVEGGALSVLDPVDAERVRRLSLHGLSRSAWDRHGEVAADSYEVGEPGFKMSMTDVEAAIGLCQLRKLDARTTRRAELAGAYDERLAGLPLDLPPGPDPRAEHAHHLYAVRIGADATLPRDEVISELRARGIGSTVHFRGIHLYRFYRDRYGIDPATLPVASDLSARLLTLPLHPDMSDTDVDAVGSALEEILL